MAYSVVFDGEFLLELYEYFGPTTSLVHKLYSTASCGTSVIALLEPLI